MGLNKKQQKIVEQLERRVELCREFMNDWLLFNQVLSSYPNSGVNKAQLENQFLKIKSKLAREHKVLQQTLMDDYTLDGNTMNIISGATSLEAIYSQSEVALKKLQTEWHRAFISINETLGVIEDKKGRAERGEKVFLVTADMLAGGKGGGGGGGMAPGTKNLLIAVAVIAVIAVVMYFDIGGIGSMYKSALGMQ
ncbi:MAG TPA: hypothetical protein P5141_07805 [Candidatus Hydrogenedentes bacterium]|nr:hypothetical protein [Candidatus Hydrogenedentota bacterium]HOC71629.1 hypothetical protein [Candidatus Hydrogenedentota bacterium]HOH50326.1 hypothetical protein [Candidatus Hydrogenedentota bacterium]HPA40428.1 hypothetical protein [Candidatus Hydrogenedentota bacterium]HQL94057.1 hypothetical protein [Candidatus Hydrogenedentota bacterium]